MTYYLAISPYRSGIYRFETPEERDDWIVANRGQAIERRHVDPELLAEIDAGR